LLWQKSTSGYEALTADFTKRKRYHCCKQDRQIAEAKKHALLMAEAGYTQPIQDVKVLGKQALGMFLVGTDQMEAGNTSQNMTKKSQINWHM
jgi:3-hydroxyacyl-CoA dehydrogenase